jgi:hypothetical protein
MNPKETGCEDVNLIHLAQDRVQWQAAVSMAMKFQVPQKAGDFLISSVIISLSRTVLHAVS